MSTHLLRYFYVCHYICSSNLHCVYTLSVVVPCVIFLVNTLCLHFLSLLYAFLYALRNSPCLFYSPVCSFSFTNTAFTLSVLLSYVLFLVHQRRAVTVRRVIGSGLAWKFLKDRRQTDEVNIPHFEYIRICFTHAIFPANIDPYSIMFTA